MIILVLLISGVFQGMHENRAYADTATPLTLQDPIREWIIDEPNGYIYAVSTNANKLLFIRLNDLQVEKQLTLDSGPSDLVQSGGKLYVALSGKTSIAVVDLAQKIVERTIPVSYKPYELAIDGNKLFYAEYDQWCHVAEYDLVTQTETVLDPGFMGRFFAPDVAVDTVNHILYIGESGSSGSNLYSYNTNNLQPISITTYDNNYGFGYPSRKVIVDDNQVFYAGHRFKNTDLTSIQGSYQSSIAYVHGNHVFTNDVSNSGNAAPTHAYVYDRDGFAKITDLTVASRKILMDSQNHIYSYTGSDPWYSVFQMSFNRQLLIWCTAVTVGLCLLSPLIVTNL